MSEHDSMVAEQLHHVLVQLGARPASKGHATAHDRVYLIADAEQWLNSRPWFIGDPYALVRYNGRDEVGS